METAPRRRITIENRFNMSIASAQKFTCMSPAPPSWLYPRVERRLFHNLNRDRKNLDSGNVIVVVCDVAHHRKVVACCVCGSECGLESATACRKQYKQRKQPEKRKPGCDPTQGRRLSCRSKPTGTQSQAYRGQTQARAVQ